MGSAPGQSVARLLPGASDGPHPPGLGPAGGQVRAPRRPPPGPRPYRPGLRLPPGPGGSHAGGPGGSP